MSAERQRTREVERARVEAVTETETEHYCPHCEQWFDDEEEMVPVVIGPRDTEPENDHLCAHCAETVFGFEPGMDLRGAVRRKLDDPSIALAAMNGVAVILLGAAAVGTALLVPTVVQQASVSLSGGELPMPFIIIGGVLAAFALMELIE